MTSPLLRERRFSSDVLEQTSYSPFFFSLSPSLPSSFPRPVLNKNIMQVTFVIKKFLVAALKK
jgi:hypothetical protein